MFTGGENILEVVAIRVGVCKHRSWRDSRVRHNER